MQQTISFPSGSVQYLFDGAFSDIWQFCDPDNAVLITDATIAALYPHLFADRKVIVLPSGEQSKNLHTIEYITQQLLGMEATRSSVLIGVGGGVVSDITGFAASVFMRGISCGFIPTTLLGMVDAAVGGKNGVNVGLNKNITGTIRQPQFIVYDADFLQTLPDMEWSNGFAEIIKYACLFDEDLFTELSAHDIDWYKNGKPALQKVIARCVALKNETVIADEHEKNVRKLLNFGHTAAHAIENVYSLPHGQAVAIGMVIAATLSEQETGLAPAATLMLKSVLQEYGLPVNYPIEVQKAMNLLRTDKKRTAGHIDFILLNHIGEAVIKPLPFHTIEQALTLCAQ